MMLALQARQRACSLPAPQAHRSCSQCIHPSSRRPRRRHAAHAAPPGAALQAARIEARPAGLLERALHDPPDWPLFLGIIFQSGALTGTLLDGIHSRVGLQVHMLGAAGCWREGEWLLQKNVCEGVTPRHYAPLWALSNL